MRSIEVRRAVVPDAPAMGRVMVESFLAAHRDQIPEAAYRKRVTEWTPEVSAGGWARALAEIDDGSAERDVLLVAHEDGGALVGLVSGGVREGDLTGTVAEVGALYVLPARQGHGVGRALLRDAATRLAARGFLELRLDVLSANLPARAFYEAMGGRAVGQGTVDEEGHLLPVTVFAWPDITALVGERPA